MNTEFNIHYHIICDNDYNLIKYAIPYWKLYASKIFIYLTNNSSEECKNELSKYKDLIYVFNINTNNVYNPFVEQNLFNSVWKGSKGKCDFCFVGYISDLLFFKNFNLEINKFINNKCTLFIPFNYEILNNNDLVLNNDDLLHKSNCLCYFNRNTFSGLFFNPNEIDELNFDYINNRIDPKGNIKYYSSENVLIFNTKYIDFDIYLEKHKNRQNLLVNNLRNCKFNNDLSKSEDELKNIYNNKLNNLYYTTFVV